MPMFLLIAFLAYLCVDVYISAPMQKDLNIITALKADCEEVHRAECEISVYYLPKASVPYDGQ